MMDSVIIAARLLIAAMVMAVRFVGCGLETAGTGTPCKFEPCKQPGDVPPPPRPQPPPPAPRVQAPKKK